MRFTSTWCKTFAIILDIFILWIGPFIGCTDGEMVLREVVGIGLGKAAFKVEDAGVTGADECVFVGDGTFKVGNGALQGFDAGLLLGNDGVFVGKTVGHFLLQTVGEFGISSDGSIDGTG